MLFTSQIIYSESTPETQEFMQKEWRSSNFELFGREIEDIEWRNRFILHVYDLNSNLIGIACCNVVGNTLRLSQLLVKEILRKKMGIGSFILRELEELCIKNHWHKIRLTTSENNIKFYEKNGFRIEATLNNDAFGITWFILSKFTNI